MTRMSLATPSDYSLARDLCSYGYFLLEPNLWDPKSGVYSTTLNIEGLAVTVRVRQGEAIGAPLVVRADCVLGASQRRHVREQLVRVLRLDEHAATIAEFHGIDPRFASTGRGRLMRSATLFEDVLKTVTSCNVTWPSTLNMNRRLCAVFGTRSASGAYSFPTAAKLARARPTTLRARCSVGYRDVRMVGLARIFAAAERGKRSELDLARLVDSGTPDQAVFDALIELPGIGPYAAANILQLLGRYSRLPLDTESIRHGKMVLGFKGSPAQIMKKVNAHYEPFGAHKFRSYWFELWSHYEQKRGPSWMWERETTGKTFTAALLD